MFRTVPLSIIRSSVLTNSNGICHTGLLTTCEQDQDGTAVPVWHNPLPCVQWKTSDDGQRNCPKHVEFYSKNKFEELVHIIDFITRIYHDARSPENQIFEVCIPFLPTRQCLVGSKHIPELILNKWIVVSDWTYCGSCYLKHDVDESS